MSKRTLWRGPRATLGSARRRRRAWSAAALGLLLLLAAEARTSYLQSRIFSKVAQELTFDTRPGVVDRARYPDGGGPYDERLGYARLGDLVARLRSRGYQVVRQAEPSLTLARWMDAGGYAVYPEKSQAGLRVVDRRGQELFSRRYPRFVYRDFEQIPRLIVNSLRFIENRELLEAASPFRNPAVEWDRFVRAGWDYLWNALWPGHPRTGGSTLATQLEKVRHARNGQTQGVGDKLAQIAAASARAYRDGRATFEAQQRIFTDYVNSIPLAAIGGYGEVHGLGDGLWAWFGVELEAAGRLLNKLDEGRLAPGETTPAAQTYRRTLALLLALGKPTLYLVKRPDLLDRRIDSYLRVMAREGVISQAVRDHGLAARTDLRTRAPRQPLPAVAERKAVDALRAELLSELGLRTLYELDRLDLEVRASLDGAVGRQTTTELLALNEAAAAREAGLLQYPMLSRGDPQDVVYSFTLYERREDLNLLRIQADTWPAPLNINEGAKLELGSTAKLRTLISYLSAIAEIHARYADQWPHELLEVRAAAADPLTRWVVERLSVASDRSLAATLEAALARRYSASPHERFFTGGGLHAFSNFDADDNYAAPTVRQAFQRSVNLVFIRMMRDVVRYQTYQTPSVTPDILRDPAHPKRRAYLERFARLESAQFLSAFYRERAGLDFAASVERLLEKARKSAKSMAAVHRYLWPRAEFVEFEHFVRERLPGRQVSQDLLVRLYDQCAPGAFDLQDRGYLADVHPLELWLVRELALRPEATLDELMADLEPAIRESYRWLFTIKRKSALDHRIRIVMERDAFERIHQEWRRLGYPFERLTPSYASAIGSSGDRPAALAALVGILLHDGLRRPAARIEELRFAAGTPFEVVMRPRPGRAERVLAPEVARAVRQAMIEVVEKGTGRRAAGAVVYSGGDTAVVGGKTGTGDNRFQEVDTRGRILASRVVNRTGTFVFFVDDRFFGVVTAYVPGQKAAGYRFTSALPSQVFRNLALTLRPLLEG